MLEYFKKLLEEDTSEKGSSFDERVNPEERERVFNAYVAMFESFKELHRTRGVPQDLIDALLNLDKKVEAMEPGVLEKIQSLQRKVQMALKQHEKSRCSEIHTKTFRSKTNAK